MLSASHDREHLLISDNIAGAGLPAKQLTVEAWVRIDKTLKWGGICGALQDNGDFERGWLLGYKNDRFLFGLTSEKKKRLTYLTASSGFETGYWYHVAATYDGKTMSLYVDGKRNATSSEQTGPIAYPPMARYVIGSYQDENEFYPLSGQIHRVAVFDQGLSEQQVAQRFNEGSSLYPDIHAVVPDVVGWPTYLRDNQRTGLSQEELSFPLKKQWAWRAPLPPQSAWPPPAKTDFWNRKYDLKPRVVFDRAFQPVSVGEDVLLGTSGDCRIVCRNAATGEERWSFFADAPVRLAPTITGNDVIFGADDGCVYSLKRTNGNVNWKYRFDEVPERWIPGNQRIMSSMPIRSGVLIEDDVAYFCAGMFPGQGVFQIAVDVKTGQKLASSRIGVSAQGYLERRSGQLYVPAARDPAGAFASQLSRRGKGVGRTINSLAEDYRYAFIGSKGVRIGGGEGRIAAFQEDDGKEIWSAEVDGTAWGLAVSEGRLLVSTDSGIVYAFGTMPDTGVTVPEVSDRNEQRYQPPRRIDRYKNVVEQIIAEAGTTKGYCLVLDSGDGHLARELALQSEFRIVAMETDPERAEHSRRMLAADGLHGRVTVQCRPQNAALPFTDYMFNLIASDHAVTGGKSGIKIDNLKRMLRPETGIAFLGDRPEHVVRRQPLEGVGEWTHMYANPANTSCSTDNLVRGSMQLQWFGEPGPRNMINRHHRTVAPLWKDGRLFIPGNDQVFVADAYNGTLLWSRKVANSRRIAAFRDCSNMAAGRANLFLAADNHCFAFHPQTGYTEHTFVVPAANDEKPRDWGYVATVGHQLFGSGVKPGASRREHTRESIMEGAYSDARQVVCSDNLFAYNTDSTASQWIYEAKSGAIINSTITVRNGRIFFVESASAKTLHEPSGRNVPSTLLANGAFVVAVDATTGGEVWRTPADVKNVEHNLYLQAASGKLVLVGSRNSGTDKKQARVVYEIRTFDVATGKPGWTTTQTQATKIAGDHGEQDLHPVIVGDRLYCEPKAYQLESGELVEDWGWKLGKRSGCGNLSASANALFFRQSNPTMFDLQAKKQQPVTTSTRPGCLINIIPAGGLLLIPEASSGCTCNYGVQTSLAFLPVPPNAD